MVFTFAEAALGLPIEINFDTTFSESSFPRSQGLHNVQDLQLAMLQLLGQLCFWLTTAGQFLSQSHKFTVIWIILLNMIFPGYIKIVLLLIKLQ